MGISYQDIESRLRTVEDKIDFVMKTFSVTRAEQSILVPGQVIQTTMTLLDVYREMKTQGAMIIPFPSSKPTDEVASPIDEVTDAPAVEPTE